MEFDQQLLTGTQQLTTQAWASTARGRGGPWPPWIFIHGTNIVDRGLIVPFFGIFMQFCNLFSRCPPHGRGL